jgi:hypothetical protein
VKRVPGAVFGRVPAKANLNGQRFKSGPDTDNYTGELLGMVNIATQKGRHVLYL